MQFAIIYALTISDIFQWRQPLGKIMWEFLRFSFPRLGYWKSTTTTHHKTILWSFSSNRKEIKNGKHFRGSWILVKNIFCMVKMWTQYSKQFKNMKKSSSVYNARNKKQELSFLHKSTNIIKISKHMGVMVRRSSAPKNWLTRNNCNRKKAMVVSHARDMPSRTDLHPRRISSIISRGIEAMERTNIHVYTYTSQCQSFSLKIMQYNN